MLTAEGEAAKEGLGLIEVENGSLDIFGGTLRFPAIQRALLTPYLVRVKGGDLRLHDCHLEGALFDAANNFRALVRFKGAGTAASRTPQCAIDECVLTSPRAGLSVAGVGARLRLERSLVVAGTDAFDFDPGRGPYQRLRLSCILERVLVAARRSVVHLGAVVVQAPPTDPLLVQSQHCASSTRSERRPACCCLKTLPCSRGAALAERRRRLRQTAAICRCRGGCGPGQGPAARGLAASVGELWRHSTGDGAATDRPLRQGTLAAGAAAAATAAPQTHRVRPARRWPGPGEARYREEAAAAALIGRKNTCLALLSPWGRGGADCSPGGRRGARAAFPPRLRCGTNTKGNRDE